MASLNTLRTKFGVVLSVIIALALLAFILSLRDDMGFSGNDPKVGEIDGSKVAYSEYYDIYEQVREQSGAQESDEQQSALLANTAWQTLVARRVLAPGFEKAGLWVSEQERQAMIAGKEYSPVFYQAFADPRTGVCRRQPFPRRRRGQSAGHAYLEAAQRAGTSRACYPQVRRFGARRCLR